MTKNISEKTALYRLRLKNNLTQRQIAELINSSIDQVSKLENGNRKLAPEWLERLSQALHCTKAELLGDAPSIELTDDEKTLLDTFRMIDPDFQSEAINYIKFMSASHPKKTSVAQETA